MWNLVNGTKEELMAIVSEYLIGKCIPFGPDETELTEIDADKILPLFEGRSGEYFSVVIGDKYGEVMFVEDGNCFFAHYDYDEEKNELIYIIEDMDMDAADDLGSCAIFCHNKDKSNGLLLIKQEDHIAMAEVIYVKPHNTKENRVVFLEATKNITLLLDTSSGNTELFIYE